MTRWRSLSPGARAVVVVVAVFVVVNLAVALASELAPEPSGPRSSSFATTRGGLGAYADLLAASGHEVTRARERLDDRTLRPSETVVVLDPDDLTDSEVHALARFARRGGRLVFGGKGVEDFLPNLVAGAPRARVAGVVAPAVLAPAPEAPPGTRVITAGEGAWPMAGAGLPVLGAPGRSVLSVADVGRGRVLLLADAAPLQNGQLGRADNAALGLALAGPASAPVAFVESVHGFGERDGARRAARRAGSSRSCSACSRRSSGSRRARGGSARRGDPCDEPPPRGASTSTRSRSRSPRTRDPAVVARAGAGRGAAGDRPLAGVRADAPRRRSSARRAARSG